MLPFLTESFGNPTRRTPSAGRRGPPSTRPTSGSRARLNAEAREIVFTSGGTEANNLAHQGRGLGRQGAAATGS